MATIRTVLSGIGRTALPEISRLCRQFIHDFRFFGMAQRFPSHINPPTQSAYLRNTLRVAKIITVFLCALGLTETPCWASSNYPTGAFGNNSASFTYTGNQSGLTTGTVYVLSTYGQYLGFCAVTPTPNSSNPYSSDCFTNYGAQNANLYSAITYMGTVNNPNNAFVVGDNAGRIGLVTLNWTLSNNVQVVTSLTTTQNSQGCPSGYQVANLAMDPNGSYLYIGCLSNTAEVTTYKSGKNSPNYALPTYNLYIVPILSTGALGSFQQVTGLFSNIFVDQTVTAGFWSGVAPIMREYQPNAPNLSNSSYYTSGAVMVSGLVGGLSDNAYNGPGPVPLNAGVLCSNGQCKVSYSFNLEAKSSFSVMSAAEAGVDYYNGSYNPSLYWNQVQGEWYCGVSTPYSCLQKNSKVPWSSTANAIYSCNIGAKPIGSPTTSCGSYSHSLSWPAQGMPAAGNGSQVDVTNLLYIPTPTGITTAFTQGFLTIGTWTNGYLAYHSPSVQNYSTALLLSGANNGQVGNVTSLLNDQNGNLMFSTDVNGLFVFNPFPVSTNTADGTGITLIPNEADSGNGCSPCLGTIYDTVGIIYYSVATIAKLAGAPTPSKSSEERKGITSPTTALAPAALGSVLGELPYSGSFRYSETQLKELGVKKGTYLRGLKFRSSHGITAQFKYPVVFKAFELSVSGASGANRGGGILGGARNTSLIIGPRDFPQNQVYPQSSNEGAFGKTLWFDKPYVYLGGDLEIRITHEGQTSNNQKDFSIDAFQTPGLQGVYKVQGGKTQSIPVAPVVRFVQ